MKAVAACAALLAAACLSLLSPLPAAAQEQIRSYDVEIDVNADGSIDVAEHITVRAEGTQVRRGIYRDFPTSYRDRHGNRVRVDFKMLGVERNGLPEPWFTERHGNGIRINTGDDDFLPTLPAEYTFTIRYRTTRQLGFFAEHDELYWNATGTDWAFPIETASVIVRLPEPVDVALLGVEGYTGPQGAQGTAYTASTPAPGTARFALTQPLGSYEGLTIVLTFPKGLVAEPTRADRFRWFLQDNAGVLVALAGLLVLLLYCAVTWHRYRSRPAPGCHHPALRTAAGPYAGIPARRASHGLRHALLFRRPPRTRRGRARAHPPGGAAPVQRLAPGAHGPRHGASGGHQRRRSRCRRRRRGRSPGAGSGQRCRRAAGVSRGADGAGAAGAAHGASGSAAGLRHAQPHDTQRPLLDGLFSAGREIELDDKNATIVSGARDAHRKAVERATHPRYFRRNAGHAGFAYVILVVTVMAAFATSGGAGILAIMLVLLAMLGINSVFSVLVRAPTAEGRRLLDEIEGLRLYLGVAERDDLARLQSPGGGDANGDPPQLDADRYEALLPFAVALEVEDAWTKKFTLAVGAAAVAAATGRMGWYAGSGRATDLGSFTRDIGSSLTSSIASASTPPGSSSGSGGGGSSGGGGGGGGGGGR
jgi:uncharacterized membrane protein YgcG